MIKKFLVSLIIVTIVATSFCTVIKPTPARADGADWLNGWLYREAITIQYNNQVGGGVEDEIDFPVLLSFTELSDIKDGASDVRFTASDGTTLLPREIEYYTDGSLMVWVKIPTLSYTADTNIYIYYGNSSAVEPVAADPSYYQKVWTNNFIGVWHLGETGVDSQAKDSTSNGNDSSSQIWSPTASGKIGSAGSFDGSTSSINFTSNDNLNPANITVSVWAKATVNNKWQYPVLKDNQWNFGRDNLGRYYLAAWNVSGINIADKHSPSSGSTSWEYNAFTYDGSYAKYYADNEVIIDTPVTGNLATTTNIISIGSQNNAGNYWNGSIDEVQIASVARSAGWLETAYNNQNDPEGFFVITGSESFYEGSGFHSSPFQIDNCQKLQSMAGDLNAHYILTGSFSCSGIANFVPIGTLDNPFAGEFDGAGYTISDLTINRADKDQVGLFGVAQGNSIATNINLKDVNIVGQNRVGALIGYGSNSTGIASSSVSGTVSGNTKVGGLVGSASSIDISNSSSTATVSANYSGPTSNQGVGGLLGAAYGVNITDSYNAGTINAVGPIYTGGLVGSANSASINRSYNSGNVSGDSQTHTVGGLLGSALWPEIYNSFNSGSVSGQKRIGGLIGSSPYITISNSYNSGSVTANYTADANDDGGDGAGGLVGINSMEGLSGPFKDTGNQFVVSNSFNVGTISAAKNTGSLLGLAATITGDDSLGGGRPDKMISLTNDFWYKPVGSSLTCNSQLNISSGCDSVSLANSFRGNNTNPPMSSPWDSDVWTFPTGYYPQLKNLPLVESAEIIEPTPEPTSSHHSIGSSIPSRVSNLRSMGNTQAANDLIKQFPTLFNSGITNSNSNPSLSTTFIRNLKIGMTGEDVRQLQIFLNTHGFVLVTTGLGSPGNETTTFGNLTRATLIKFQKANNITPAVGYFGPITRAFVQSVLGTK
jgi:hypothetical protein